MMTMNITIINTTTTTIITRNLTFMTIAMAAVMHIIRCQCGGWSRVGGWTGGQESSSQWVMVKSVLRFKGQWVVVKSLVGERSVGAGGVGG